MSTFYFMNVLIFYIKTLFDLKVYFFSSVFKRRHLGGSLTVLWALAWYPLSLMVELGLGVGWSGFPSSSATVVAPRETYPLTGASLPLFLPGIPSFSPMPGHRRLPAVGLGGLAQESSAGLLTSSADESAL